MEGRAFADAGQIRQRGIHISPKPRVSQQSRGRVIDLNSRPKWRNTAKTLYLEIAPLLTKSREFYGNIWIQAVLDQTAERYQFS